MIKLGISGCWGRMGQKIAGLAIGDNAFTISALLEYKDHPKVKELIFGMPVSTNNDVIETCDVLIEFTLPDATLQNLEACVKYGKPMVIGTTGIDEDGIAKINNAAKKIPIIFSSNMSIGVNVFFKMTELVGKKLQHIKDITVYEEHHIYKKDKPSGTAKTIAEIAGRTSGCDVRFLEPLREGEIVGNHEIVFETFSDILKMYHHAKSREMFAAGALAAAKFLVGKNPGPYNMQQVLGLDKIII